MSTPLRISPEQVRDMTSEQLEDTLRSLIGAAEEDRKRSAITYYKPNNSILMDFHRSPAKVRAIGGGNRAGKTQAVLAEIASKATGILPLSLEGKVDPTTWFRGPIQVRIVCESLTTVLDQVILGSFQWWRWHGADAPGGLRGHYGWIPHGSLISGEWDKSYSSKLRTLSVYYRDPNQPERILGQSQIQFNSYDQDPSDFASGEFHLIHHDEPPPLAIWRENQARVMSVGGDMTLAMTWPDDPTINVDWLFDEVYEPASHSPDIDWFNIFTMDNPNVDQQAISEMAEQWSEEVRKVRLLGQPMRFTNRVHQLFTDQTSTWCFSCGKPQMVTEGSCFKCRSEDYVEFNHVQDFAPDTHWPTIWLLDPHPRKPHMFCWAQITPADDVRVVAEGECEGDPVAVREYVDEIEQALGLNVVMRMIDPNMGRSPSGVRRGVTWQDEFDAAGLNCDLADDSDVGRSRINEYLQPDRHTREPRLLVRSTCENTALQMKRYVWDDWRKGTDKDLKQLPKNKYDDYPTLLKYLMNIDPTFTGLQTAGHVIRRRNPAPRHREANWGLRR